jgi:hypothetical protein
MELSVINKMVSQQEINSKEQSPLVTQMQAQLKQPYRFTSPNRGRKLTGLQGDYEFIVEIVP